MWLRSRSTPDNTKSSPPTLLSCCVNCCVTLSAYTSVSFVTFPKESKTRASVFQGLQLVFKGQEISVDQSHPNQYKFCSKCGESFGKLFKLYHDFLRSSATGSYVRHLVNNTSNAASFENIENDNSVLSTGDIIRCSIKSEELEEDGILDFDEPILEDDEVKPSPAPTKRRQQRKRIVISEQPQLKFAIPDSVFEQDSLTSAHSTSVEASETDSVKSNSHKKIRKPLKKKKQEKKLKEDSFPTLIAQPGCKLCSSVEFNAKRYYHMHQAKHRGERPFDCEKCNTCYRTKVDLKKHNRNCHRIDWVPERGQAPLYETTKYICHKCKEVSLSSFKEWILHHSEMHHSKFGYGDVKLQESVMPRYGLFRPCPLCGKPFKHNRLIVTHMTTAHPKERPFSCDICHKAYTNKSSLRHHAYLHKGDPQQFLCRLCGQCFKTKGNMEHHEKAHTGDILKKFECETCHAMFESNSAVSKHKLVHSDIRPCVCDTCGKTFKVIGHLLTHQRQFHYKKHIVDQFCKLCGKGYAFKIRLKEHLMGTHKLSKEEARASAEIESRKIFRILPNGEHVVPERPLKSKTCGYCQRTYVRLEQLFTHLMAVHGKTKEEAKEITGLESKRNLTPGAGSTRRTLKTGPSFLRKDYLLSSEQRPAFL